MKHNKDFSRETIKNLKIKGIIIYNRTWLPGEFGDFANGETGYIVNDNGTSKVKTYLEIVKISKGEK